MSDYDREENLRLWQDLTSSRISLRDIEQVVYKDSWDEVMNYICEPSLSNNPFYTYLENTADREVENLLLVAKDLEARWKKKQSPWYYPRERTGYSESSDYHDIIKRCQEYDGERLRDRYALQAVRALFASRCYDECISYCDSAFANIPDTNLMKRMAMRYAAGSWNRLGHKAKADTIFALTGDIWSISNNNPVKLMADLNPDAPQLMEYIRSVATDSDWVCNIVPVARRMLKNRHVKNKGDWHFFMAHYYYMFEHNPKQTLSQIYRALGNTFSTSELKDLARIYKMKLEAHSGSAQPLVADMRWLERKCDVLNPDAKEWIRRIQNILYQDWIPEIWKKQQYATAIMLAAYADNLEPIASWRDSWRGEAAGSIDYGSLSFQMMGSLTSSELAQACREMQESTPLLMLLRKNMCADSNYYKELLGTLALREENYGLAIMYLSEVSPAYQRDMNIYNYLRRNPFAAYPSRWETFSFSDEDDGWEIESKVSGNNTVSPMNAKLNFAQRMLAYQEEMNNGETADKRGLAALMYAIGRRNSLEECWALTQYWRGCYVGLFVPELDYWSMDSCTTDNYAFLYDYESTVGHNATEARYDREIKASLAMLESDEARAQAEYLLGNLSTVVKRYGKTTTARLVKTSCDNWQSWLR